MGSTTEVACPPIFRLGCGIIVPGFARFAICRKPDCVIPAIGVLFDNGDSPRIPSGATAACISQCSSFHGKEALLDIRLWLPVPYLGAMMQGRELARLRVAIGQILTVLGIEIQPIAYCQDNH